MADVKEGSEPQKNAGTSEAEIHQDIEKRSAHAGGVVNGLRKKSLKLAGASFILADSALITSGYMQGSGGIGAAGVFGLMEGAVGAHYGNPKAEKQLEQIDRHLGAYLRKQGVEIPKDPTTEGLTKKGCFFDHAESFLYAYPSQVMNALYSAIGVSFVQTGRKINKEFAETAKAGKGNALLWSGGLLVTAALAGLLIPEKKPDPEHPPENAMQKLWSKVQEKPLRVTGILMNANQVFLAKNALEDRVTYPGNKGYLFKLLAVAGFTMGNTMLALSSKQYDSGSKLDEKTLNALAESSATVIAAQPKEVQNALLEQISGFLSTRPNIPMKAEEISKVLHAKLEEVRNRPQEKQTWAARAEDIRDQQALPSL